MGKFNKDPAPVKEGDVITQKCEGKGSKGAGMFRKEGFIIFVEGTEEGKKYEIKITKVMQRVAFGEIVQIIN